MNAHTPVSVALIEDDDELREATSQALMLEGFEVLAFADAEPALDQLSREFEGVVVTDIRMPKTDGLELMAQLAERDPELPVILMTGHGDVAMAVEAMKQGASDFLTKPFRTPALVEAIRRAAARRALVIENRQLREALHGRATAGLLGTSDAVRQLDRLVTELARTELDIHITGDDGVGKTWLARRVHELSPRRERPFVAIDGGIWNNADAELLVFGRDRAAGLSRSGLIERAQGGTLLIDDADRVPESLRGRIRSFLETRSFLALGAERPRKIDVRIFVTSTGKDGDGVGAGERRLADYLGGVTLRIPSLNDRREDIAAIFRLFLNEFEHEFGSSAPAPTSEEWTYLLQHEWPGGLRELRDFARAYALGLSRVSIIQPGPDGLGSSLRELVSGFEKAVLEDALRKANGQVSLVEQILAIKRKTLYDKLARYRINPQEFRQDR